MSLSTNQKPSFEHQVENLAKLASKRVVAIYDSDARNSVVTLSFAFVLIELNCIDAITDSRVLYQDVYLIFWHLGT